MFNRPIQTRRHPNQEGEILSSKSRDAIKKILENAKLNQKDISNSIINPKDNPDLEWPLLIGRHGDVIVLYEKNPLGKGGFSIVYLGLHVDTGSLSAIKIHNVMTDEACQEVAREHNALRLIGALRDTVEINSSNGTTIYTVQDLLWGENLLKVLQALRSVGNSLELKTEINMCLSIVEEFSKLHAKGVLHRDIKTDQILWDSAFAHASVTDFGFAIKIEDGTSLKEIVGSYMSVPPELWSKVTKIDNGHLYTESGCSQNEKTEIYGVGTILADILMDQLPFDIYTKYYDKFEPLIKITSNPMECYEVYRHSYKNFFDKVDADPIRNALLEIAKKMLEPDPNKRLSFTDAIASLETCKNEILLRDNHSKSDEYQLSEIFLHHFEQLQDKSESTNKLKY